MENVWSSQHRIFVFNKNAFSVFLSSLDHCLLSTVLLSRQRIVTIAPQITSFSMMRNDESHDKPLQLKCIHVERQTQKRECESWHCETTVRTEDPLMYSIIVNETVLSYQYFSTVHETIQKTWVGHGIFKIVFIFVDQESEQKWNPFLLKIGYQSGANKNEIRIVFVFVCIRMVKATKMCKLWSNYPFLFLFLSHIRKGPTKTKTNLISFLLATNW